MKFFKYRRRHFWWNKHYRRSGFTLIELLIVIAIIAVSAGAVFVAVNPLQRFRDARNANRWQDVTAVADAVRLYQVAHAGQMPSGIDAYWRMLGTDSSGCDIACGSSSTSTPAPTSTPGSGNPVNDFTDNSQGTFNGAFDKTQWNSGSSWVDLTTSGKSTGSGDYSSSVKDSQATSPTWTTFAWGPERPYLKQLPNNGAAETAYSAGNVNMSGNVLLYHLNESSGTLTDSSGGGKTGTVVGGVTYGNTGKLGSALTFDGMSGYVTMNCVPGTYGDNAHYTMMAWVKPAGANANNPIFAAYFASWNWFYLDFNSKRLGITTHNYIPQDYSHYASFTFTANTWYHVALVYDVPNSVSQLFVNGNVIGTKTGAIPLPDLASCINGMGAHGYGARSPYFFKGSIDEAAIFNRALTVTEVSDIYKRGALRLKLQARTCDDSACSGETFVGPDGTANSYYSEASNSNLGKPSFTLSGLSANQYFQYKAFFETDNSSFTPALSSVSMSNNATGGGGGGEEPPPEGEPGETLQPSCLDLSSILANQLPGVPQDPSLGSAGKTYYAIRRQTSGQLNVKACGAEGGETITVTK